MYNRLSINKVMKKKKLAQYFCGHGVEIIIERSINKLHNKVRAPVAVRNTIRRALSIQTNMDNHHVQISKSQKKLSAVKVISLSRNSKISRK